MLLRARWNSARAFLCTSATFTPSGPPPPHPGFPSTATRGAKPKQPARHPERPRGIRARGAGGVRQVRGELAATVSSHGRTRARCRARRGRADRAAPKPPPELRSRVPRRRCLRAGDAAAPLQPAPAGERRCRLGATREQPGSAPLRVSGPHGRARAAPGPPHRPPAPPALPRLQKAAPQREGSALASLPPSSLSWGNSDPRLAGRPRWRGVAGRKRGGRSAQRPGGGSRERGPWRPSSPAPRASGQTRGTPPSSSPLTWHGRRLCGAARSRPSPASGSHGGPAPRAAAVPLVPSPRLEALLLAPTPGPPGQKWHSVSPLRPLVKSPRGRQELRRMPGAPPARRGPRPRPPRCLALRPAASRGPRRGHRPPSAARPASPPRAFPAPSGCRLPVWVLIPLLMNIPAEANAVRAN